MEHAAEEIGPFMMTMKVAPIKKKRYIFVKIIYLFISHNSLSTTKMLLFLSIILTFTKIVANLLHTSGNNMLILCVLGLQNRGEKSTRNLKQFVNVRNVSDSKG